MSAGTLDTLAIARKLKSAGFPEDQAEAVTDVLREVRESDLSTLVTKADLKAELNVTKAELKAEIDVTRNELRREIADVKFEILKWVLPAIGFQTVVIVGAVVALARGFR